MTGKIKDLMARVGKIRILTRRLVDDRLSGDYHSSFKGQGVEFDEVRPYVPGDDVRTIDWNVTAKTGIPYIKRFAEERELTVVFMIDVSGSQGFGSGGEKGENRRTKMEVAAEVSSLLALTAIRNQDKIGLVLFSDKVEKYIPPRKGQGAVLRLVREVLAAEDGAHGKTDIAAALKFLSSVQKRKAVVFIVSDFLDSGYERLLASASRHHDMIAIPVSDPAERELPDVGLVELEDPESGELMLVDTSDAAVRRQFAAASGAEAGSLATLLRRNAIDSLEVSTDRPYISQVRALFKRRSRKK